MGYILAISRTVKDFRSESGEWLDGDYREIEAPDFWDIEIDSEDVMDDGLIVATLEAMPRGTWEASLHPIPNALAEHAWLSDSYTNPYTGHVTETTIRFKGEYTPAQRAEIFRAL